jgi:hypothetical protein
MVVSGGSFVLLLDYLLLPKKEKGKRREKERKEGEK